MERTDEAEIRKAVEIEYLFLVMVFFKKKDRLVIPFLKTLVDSFNKFLNLFQMVLITSDQGPGRRAQLDKDKLSLEIGVLLENPLDRAEALEQALGVVDAVNTDPDLFSRKVVILA
ncbi:MAG: hypothetical protein BWY49_00735 [Candidatus Omnitrophica bacterium ADurb.Bin314]|nr:MAG: hypothetical protein BWY49_00735 [Candidatus Omnitrophica bacterium ADurb.Bin314]